MSEHYKPQAIEARWQKRWAEMLATASVRHRNLLAISPWSVFPAGAPADFRFADLLPVLRYADACMLSGLPDLGHWNAGKFREFHCRASAASVSTPSIRWSIASFFRCR